MLTKIRIVDQKTEWKINFNKAINRELLPLVIANFFFLSAVISNWDLQFANVTFSVSESISKQLPPSIILIWSVLELFTMLFDSKFRALNDVLAQTTVVRKAA